MGSARVASSRNVVSSRIRRCGLPVPLTCDAARRSTEVGEMCWNQVGALERSAELLQLVVAADHEPSLLGVCAIAKFRTDAGRGSGIDMFDRCREPVTDPSNRDNEPWAIVAERVAQQRDVSRQPGLF